MVQDRQRAHRCLFGALKTNLITHDDKEAETAKNIQKREVAVTQLVSHVHDVIQTTKLVIKGIVIGDDFNTNHDQEMFAAEKTLDSLIGAGYEDGFEELPPVATHNSPRHSRLSGRDR